MHSYVVQGTIIPLPGDGHCKKMSSSEIDSRLNEVERYKRRWNLRLYGLAEQAGKDIKAQVVCEVLP